jgi:D-alanyl-D-alanine carboxypeptidase
MIDDLRAMSEAAAAAGNGIGVESAYRSYASQQDVFSSWVKRFGYARALQVSARPGHSEHQLGLAIDFRSDPGGSPFTGTWNTTPAGKWMKAHAWEYGFVMSYPKGSIALTCYDFEPWHFRYLGRELAAAIHASGLTQREYLWAHFTTTVVPPAPKATNAPGKSPAPTATAVLSPTASPSLAPTPIAPSPTPLATESPPPGTPELTPVPTQPPPANPIAGTGPVVLAGLFAGLAAVAAGAWLLRRRGRSGVGL